MMSYFLQNIRIISDNDKENLAFSMIIRTFAKQL